MSRNALLPTPPDNALLRALSLWPDRPAMALLRALEARHYPETLSRRITLDLGCGNGKFGEVLGLHKAVGLDLSIQSRLLGSKAYASFICGDIQALPFADGCIGCVMSNSTLEHVEDDIAALGEVSRVLGRGGSFYFTVPLPSKEDTLAFGTPEIAGDQESARKYREWFTAHWNHYRYRSIMEWVEMLSASSMQLVSWISYETITSGFLGDILGYVDISFPKIPVVGRVSAPQRLFVSIMYRILEPYWVADKRMETLVADEPSDGGVFLHAIRR